MDFLHFTRLRNFKGRSFKFVKKDTFSFFKGFLLDFCLLISFNLKDPLLNLNDFAYSFLKDFLHFTLKEILKEGRSNLLKDTFLLKVLPFPHNNGASQEWLTQ